MTKAVQVVNPLKRFAFVLVALRRGPKKIALASADFVALLILLWTLTSLRYRETFIPTEFLTVLLSLLAPTLAVAALAYGRMYHEVTRYFSPRGYTTLARSVAVASLAWCSAVFLAGQVGIPRSSAFVYTLASPLLIVALRLVAARYLSWAGIVVPQARVHTSGRKAVLIGSSHHAVRYLSSELNRAASVVAIIDGAETQVGRSVQGIRVHNWDRLPRILERESITDAIIATEDSSDRHTLDAIKLLRARGVTCRVYSEIAVHHSAKLKRPQLREFDIRDVLPRNEVPPDVERLRETFRGSRVLVTGAGGSIGSELVTQILAFEPELVVLLDNSEVALHRITLKSQDLIRLRGGVTAIRSVLASVADERRIHEVLSLYRIDTIFHAAALKHVPLLESEPKAAAITNVLGTHIVSHAAGLHGIQRFVLVSTDKAVRPTNVMGTTKRAAELVVAEAADKFAKTIYSSVRFGNVLGSSGSVVERFTDQIGAGGPVTVTHPEMMRYFMTVEEAASLVMEAGALAKGGETFILDMGQPHSIFDLAKTMIGLMGYTVRTDGTDEGVEIKITGIRPGEKLREELMSDASLAMGTAHPKITMLPKEAISPVHVRTNIARIKDAIESGDEALIVNALKVLAGETQPAPEALLQLEDPQKAYIH